MELYLKNPISSPVMEVRNIDDLPELMFRKDKFFLPCGDKDKRKGSYFFTVNTSIESIGSLLKNENACIVNRASSYNAYYYDHKLLRNCLKLGAVTIPGITQAKAKQDRLVQYSQMKTALNGIQTPVVLDNLHGKNFVYDLNPVISLMQKEPRFSKISLSRKISMYFSTLQSFILKKQETKTRYTRGPVFVNLDELKRYDDVNDYHFLTYLIMLFRKKQSFMTQFSCPYKVIFYTERGYLIFDMNTDLVKSNLSKLKFGVKRLNPSVNVEKAEDMVMREDLAARMNLVNGFTGSDQLDPNDSVVTAVAKSVGLDGSDAEEDIEEKISETDEDELNIEFLDDDSKKEYYNNILTKRTGYEPKQLSPRDRLLREKQAQLKIKGRTIAELTKDIDPPQIPSTKISPPGDLKVINDNITDVRFANYQRLYNETMLNKHLAEVFTCFNDKSIEVNVIDVQVEDKSDNLNMQEQYTIVMEDEARRRHTMRINVPKFIDDRFLYLNGNKKSIQKQFMGMPVIKTGPDTVQICTNYNKVFIRRYGTKFNPNMEKFRKYILKPEKGVTIVRGCNTEVNKNYLTCLEYDQFAETYTSITFGNCSFIFNAEELSKEFGDKYASDGSRILIGVLKKGSKKEPIFYDTNNPDHIDLVATMIQVARPADYDEFKKLSFGKKYMYTQATILSKKMPVVLIILFFEGMTTVLKKFDDPNVKFVDTKSNQDNNMYIPFSDGYLTYPMSDMEACIMFNGLTEFPTALYSVADMDDKDTYIAFFEHLFGSGYIAGGLMNYYDFMIDPITLRLLQMLNYPEDIVSLIIYANNLLADNNFKSDMNLSMYRLRDNELIPALVYTEMTRAYSKYRKTYNNNNPIKMSVDPDCVIKALNKIPTVEGYSKLSPSVEMRNNSIASMKGHVGMNLDKAYKQDKRVFDDSMIGIVGVSTDIAANCGKERHLVLEPSVMNALGMLKINGRENLDQLTDVNLETSMEMICPGGLVHDDPVRTAMASKQSGHAIPVKNQSPLLVSNGFDSTIQYRTCDDFSVVAVEDGEVIDLDEKLQIMVIKYKSGKTKAIDLSPSIAKNG